MRNLSKLFIITILCISPILTSNRVLSVIPELPYEKPSTAFAEQKVFKVKHEAFLPNGLGINLREIQVRAGTTDTFLQFDLGIFN